MTSMLNETRILLPLPRNLRKAWAIRQNLARSRRALGQLDAQALRDIGLSPAAAQAEAQRPIWDVPANWICR